MRLLRVRFTIRTLLIVVAISGTLLGVGIGAARLKRRSDYCRSRAIDFATKESLFAKHVKELEAMAAEQEHVDKRYSDQAKRQSGLERLYLVGARRLLFERQTDRTQKNIERCKQIVSHFAMMKMKYQVATSRPWRSVPPDPPGP